MAQGNPERDYDESLRVFVSERESIAQSKARMWQGNVLATSVVLAVFLAGINFSGGQFADIASGLLPLTFDNEPLGYGIFTWIVSGLALAFIAYSRARVLYFSRLSEWVASSFTPKADDLLNSVESDRPKDNPLADLRSRFYNSYEHILTKQFLDEEYRDYHEARPEGGRLRGSWKFIKTLVAFFAGGRWISLDPRLDEEQPHCYRFMSDLWPHALLRSVCLGLFWASTAAILVARALGSHGLSNVFLVVAAAFFVPYFVQFITFWGRIEKLSEEARSDIRPQIPYTCPTCQGEVVFGSNCEACGQPIDWGSMDVPRDTA